MSEPDTDARSDNQPLENGLAPEEKPLGALALIAVYKLVKAVIAIAGGIILLQLGRRNLVHVAHGWFLRLGLDPEGRFGTIVLAHLSAFDPHRQHLMVAVFFGYAILYCVEAVGLCRQKRWAEWLTVVQTLILVPLEIYELARGPGIFKVLALSLSVGVVLYLVWRIRRDDRLRARSVNGSR